ncbi:MAG: 37S ribosomal protein S23 mitochondrial [Geoglossum umbratile]|nr:MAG: 37S ribosomal protein S23 mitochondrial [Geoglossum umbratile]
MASQSCWRCLFRCPLSVYPGNRLFSTTPAFLASPIKAKKTGQDSNAPRKGVKSLRIRKKSVQKSGKPPASGERKAIRKRIVLSNTSALEVKGMRDLNDENMTDEQVRGTVVGLPGPLVSQLRAAEAFRTGQGWGLFRRPGVLMRGESLEIARALEDVESEKKVLRRIYTGERGSGKSVMLLQAISMALLRDWVVVTIPEAQDLINAHTEYAPLSSTTPTQYVQRSYAASLLSRISRANATVLSKLAVSLTHRLPIPIRPDHSLLELADFGIKDPDMAWPIFQTLWDELTSTDVARPPIMFTLDGLGHIMRDSQYRDAAFQPIHAHDLAIVRHFVDYLSGVRSLPNGGAFIAATSASNTPSTPSLALALSQRLHSAKALSQQTLIQRKPIQRNPFVAYDERVLQSITPDLDVAELQGLSREEAHGLMEYYAASGMLRHKVDERFVTEKWTIAGSGVVGELEKAAVAGARV